MARILKTNTAVRIVVGPLVDLTDGTTLETELTVTGLTVNLISEANDGGAPTKRIDAVSPTASSGNNDMVAIQGGYYDLEITATQVNFVGRAKFGIYDVDAIAPYFEEWIVLAANVYDALMGTDKLQVHADEITNGLITAAAIADGAIDNATLAADIGSTDYATNIIALAVRKVLDELNLDHLMKVAVGNEANLTTEVADNTVLSLIMTQDGDTSVYFPSGCSLVGISIMNSLISTNLGGVDGDDGAGLTAIPWNAAWDEEVQSEVQDAIELNNLDHLIKVAKDTDWATTITKESIIDLMTSKDTSQTFSRSTEALEAIRDRGDLSWLTGAGQAADTVTFPASVTKVVGGTLSGNHTNLTAIDASYCSLVETTTGTFLELNVGFAAPAGNSIATLRVWGYYDGGGGHYIKVQALDQVGGSIYEDVGTIPIAARVQAYSFNLAPEHIKADGTVNIKFLHNASTSGIVSHVLYLDKVQVSSVTPVTEVDANLIKILDTALTETSAGYLSLSFKKLFDVATPVFTVASVNQSGDSYPLIDTEIAKLLSLVTNKRGLRKTDSVWYIYVRNVADDADILLKALKDKDGNNITDIQAGAIAIELASSV